MAEQIKVRHSAIQLLHSETSLQYEIKYEGQVFRCLPPATGVCCPAPYTHDQGLMSKCFWPSHVSHFSFVWKRHKRFTEAKSHHPVWLTQLSHNHPYYLTHYIVNLNLKLPLIVKIVWMLAASQHLDEPNITLCSPDEMLIIFILWLKQTDDLFGRDTSCLQRRQESEVTGFISLTNTVEALKWLWANPVYLCSLLLHTPRRKK